MSAIPPATVYNFSIQDPLMFFPKEIGLLILSFLRAFELEKCEAVSKSWKQLCLESQLWQFHCTKLGLAPFQDSWKSGYTHYIHSRQQKIRALFAKKALNAAQTTIPRICSEAKLRCFDYHDEKCVLGLSDGTLYIHREKNNKSLLFKEFSSVTHLQFDDSKILSSFKTPTPSNDSFIRIFPFSENWFDLKDVEVITMDFKEEICHFQFNENILVVAESIGKIGIHDLNTLHCIRSWETDLSQGKIQKLQFNDQMIVASYPNHIKIWDRACGKQLQHLCFPSLYNMQLLSENRLFICTKLNKQSSEFSITQLSTKRTICHTEKKGFCQHIQYEPYDDHLLLSTATALLGYHTSSLCPIGHLKAPRMHHGLFCFNYLNSKLALASNHHSTLLKMYPIDNFPHKKRKTHPHK